MRGRVEPREAPRVMRRRVGMDWPRKMYSHILKLKEGVSWGEKGGGRKELTQVHRVDSIL